MKRRLLFLSFFLLLISFLNAQTSFTWTGADGLAWDNAANWSCTGDNCAGRWPGLQGAVNDDIVTIQDQNATVIFPDHAEPIIISELNLKQGALDIEGNGRLDITGDLNVDPSGNINFLGMAPDGGIIAIGGNIDLKGGFNAGQSTVIINGIMPQSFKSTGSGLVNFFNLVIDTEGGFELQRQISVSGTMQFVNGIVATPGLNKDVIFLPGSIAEGASNNSYIDGYIQKDGLEDFVFPCGNGGWYAPLTISEVSQSLPSAPVIVAVRYFHSDPNTSGRDDQSLDPGMEEDGSVLEKISEVEYWAIKADVPASLKLGLGRGAHNGTVVVPEDLRVATWESINTTPGNKKVWKNNGGALVTVPGPPNTDVVETPAKIKVGFQNLLYITMATTNLANALPVELLFFEAKPQSGQVRLRWATASEVGHAAFVVERSRYGKEFDHVAKIEGDGQDRYQQKNYQLTDEQPLPGVSYYRLRQIDLDGTTTYSDIVSVNLGAAKDGDVALFPNPARQRVTLSSADPLDDAELELYNVAGQRLPLRYSAAGPQVELPLPNLSPGVYFLRITRPGQSVLTKRLVVE